MNPDGYDAHYNLGQLYRLQERWHEAEQSLSKAASLRPDQPEVYRQRGDVLYKLGRLVDAEACYHQALQSYPGDARLLNAIGNIARDSGRSIQAGDYYRQAIRSDPQWASPLVNLGDIEQMEGRTEPSQRCFEQAMQLDDNPEPAIRIATLSPVIYHDKSDLQYWRSRITSGVRQLLEKPVSLDHPGPLFTPTHFFLPYQGYNDRELLTDMAKLALSSCPNLNYTAEHCRTDKSDRSPEKLSIAFVSRHFNYHTISKLTRGYIQHLSRGLFDVTAVFADTRKDLVSSELAASSDQVMDLPGNFERAREQLAERQFDIIFYPDLGMSDNTYFLSFARLAPLQCVTWGHPNTTGVPTVDCFLSAGVIEPENPQLNYSERLECMDNLPVYYRRPRILPSHLEVKRQVFGLDASRHVYLCPQSLFKLHPEFDSILAAILREDDDALIVLIKQMDHHIHLLRSRWERSMPDVDWSDRIIFVPEQTEHKFYSLVNVSDVVLDTIHFGGGNTHFETFAIGTPVVTLPGRFMRSRIAGGCYQQMGIADCVAFDADDYVRIALRLGGDREFREQISRRILESNSVLYENMESVRELEQVLITAYRRAVRSGTRP